MIDILLTTYNGEKYLQEQLDSLFKQTNNNFKIIIRDDISSDKTLQIINQYIELFPNKITLISDNLGNLGSSRSFMQLLKHSDAPYIMFCDQDDVWMDDKIEVALHKLHEMEHQYGKEIPLLVFSDLKVVDYSLQLIDNSFWHYQKLIPELSKNWKKLLAQNVITGCTILINQKAKEVSLPFELPNILHDQWIGVNVAKYGKIKYVKKSTILYRQHTANVAGAHFYAWNYIKFKIMNLSKPIKKLYDFSKFFKVSIVQLFFYKFTINIQRILGIR